MKTKELFSFVLPEKLRRKRVPDQEFTATLGRLPETDPAWCALQDVVHDQFEQEIIGCLSNKLTPEERTFQCGRASSLYALLQQMQTARESAHAEIAAEARKR